jgi:pimeloyl-ACP methyl ester carboxylesterase
VSDLIRGGNVKGPSSSTDNAVARFDGTTGKLIQNSSNTTIDDSGNLTLQSSNSGGLNSSDSTRRIYLQSYQKAQRLADDGVTPAHFGEVIRIDMKHEQAKGVIAFREDYLGQGPRTVAWLVAHGLSNDGTAWHNHFSIELPDENGNLQTSFEFPFATYDQPNGFGIPVNEMYNRSTTQLIASNRGLVVENAAGVNKNIYFSSGTRGLTANQRWGIQADSTAESGSNAGTNFRLNRYDDTGAFVDTVVFVRRSDKQVGINTTSPSAQLDVVGTTELNGAVSIPTSALSIGNAAAQGGAKLYTEASVSQVGMLFRNTTAGGNLAANIVSQSQTTGSRAIQIGLQSDTTNRLSIEHSGLIEWGSGGASARDTNLYRSAANTLATDDALVVGQSLSLAITTVTANTTLSAVHHTVLVDATSDNLTMTLPTATSSPGRVYVVKKIDSSANTVTIDGNASETIDGATTQAISTQWASLTIQSNGTSWFIL